MSQSSPKNRLAVNHIMARLFLSALVLMAASRLVSAQSATGQTVPPGHGANASTYTPQRVYDAREKRYSDFESMLFDLAKHEVVFVGEQHDDPATHRLERAILEGLARRRSNVVVSLEMFERDTQSAIDNYLAGRLTEEDFLKVSRPWPRYQTDYRPLVEFARAHNWPVLGANIPRKFASLVSREGLTAIDKLSAEDRTMVAQSFQCPFDDYFKKFAEVMSSHPGADQNANKDKKGKKDEVDPKMRAMTERFYYAQCVKDETMAESIARRLASSGTTAESPLVVHFNGAFHSDYRLGTAARVKNRLPKARTKVVSIVPLKSLDQIDHDEYKKRGDYILFTLSKK